MVHRIIFLIHVFVLSSLTIMAQQDSNEDILREGDVIDMSVYKPVLGFGTGVINFLGDVSSNGYNPILGDKAFKFTISTFVDPGRYFRANFFLIYGSMTGSTRSVMDPVNNLNFQTDVINFGINAEYNFNHFLKRLKWISPFISAGLGNIQFTSKGDLFDSEGNLYNYWSDGTIRDIPESLGLVQHSRIVHRDYIYETDLRNWERDQYGLGNYSKYAFSLPVDVGLDFKISPRVSCRLGTSIHFTMTDFLDNVSSTGTFHKGDKRNDIFSFSYFTIHLDLFSQPREQLIDKLFLELEYDDVMLSDEDGDSVLDPFDECPGTPTGVLIDSRGCPLDSDGDGVPDYLDLEPDTPQGNWVDENGITVTMEAFMSKMAERELAMHRKDVQDYLDTIGKGYVRKAATEIPQKFKNLDTDKDGFISFEELLKAIDDYFDYRLELTVKDLFELNSFFFAQ